MVRKDTGRLVTGTTGIFLRCRLEKRSRARARRLPKTASQAVLGFGKASVHVTGIFSRLTAFARMGRVGGKRKDFPTMQPFRRGALTEGPTTCLELAQLVAGRSDTAQLRHTSTQRLIYKTEVRLLTCKDPYDFPRQSTRKPFTMSRQQKVMIPPIVCTQCSLRSSLIWLSECNLWILAEIYSCQSLALRTDRVSDRGQNSRLR